MGTSPGSSRGGLYRYYDLAGDGVRDHDVDRHDGRGAAGAAGTAGAGGLAAGRRADGLLTVAEPMNAKDFTGSPYLRPGGVTQLSKPTGAVVRIVGGKIVELHQILKV